MRPTDVRHEAGRDATEVDAPSRVLLGCVADDYTGATDVATALRRSGFRPAILFGGVPGDRSAPAGADAVVVALKSRTAPAADAVAWSLEAADWFDELGVQRVFHKYCSTFDSTDSGNIGPVTDALLDRSGARLTVICPGSPVHGRTVYGGQLFVHDQLLSESPMRHHPLTPMTDSDLVRVLGRQTPHHVALLPHSVVRSGPAAVRERLDALEADGVRHVVTDAIDDADLRVIAAATQHLPVLTGAAGLAAALAPDGVSAEAGPAPGAGRADVGLPAGPAVVLAGSCSRATMEQLAYARERMPSHRLDPLVTPGAEELRARATAWLTDHLGKGPVLLYSSAGPEERAAAAKVFGARTAEVFEDVLGDLARVARERGAHRIVVAGGETSGAVIQRLGVESALVGHEEDPGVPWLLTPDERPLALLLKSGNFGRADLLHRAATTGTGHP
ncbi:3-oxo-tetronate kinase [Georgenia daeguensis]|uniref:3-oxo-tetronate kinase n=1 Tax=Georgenia daeguensis TaxID=908355 RepID=A0ABP8EVG4_9MICO